MKICLFSRAGFALMKSAANQTFLRLSSYVIENKTKGLTNAFAWNADK